MMRNLLLILLFVWSDLTKHLTNLRGSDEVTTWPNHVLLHVIALELRQPHEDGVTCH